MERMILTGVSWGLGNEVDPRPLSFGFFSLDIQKGRRITCNKSNLKRQVVNLFHHLVDFVPDKGKKIAVNKANYCGDDY